MLNQGRIIFLAFVLLQSFASPARAVVPSTPIASNDASGGAPSNGNVKKYLGVTYFSFFNGPGLHPDNFDITPNQLGLPTHDGIYFQNQISFRLKFSQGMALDFQTRFKTIFNNSRDNPEFRPFRWETPRIGVSGKLLEGKDWALKGAINTDFPHFTPAPFTGYQAQARKTLFTPGMFADFNYTPKESPWSIYSVVAPRYFFYSDRDVAESQYKNQGYIPQNKPEFIISLQPTINYTFARKTKLTLGSTIDYRKQIISGWNPFKASLAANHDSPAWRLDALPITLGVTYEYSNALTIFPYVGAFPIAVQRVDARSGDQATFLEAASFGMWIRGTLF